jgi:hypothetical protein
VSGFRINHVVHRLVVEDEDHTVECGCGATIGPAADFETLLDMVMEHVEQARPNARSES